MVELGLEKFKKQEKLDQYWIQYMGFVQTGVLPAKFPQHYKKRMLEMGIISKKSHGRYQK